MSTGFDNCLIPAGEFPVSELGLSLAFTLKQINNGVSQLQVS